MCLINEDKNDRDKRGKKHLNVILRETSVALQSLRNKKFPAADSALKLTVLTFQIIHKKKKKCGPLENI